MEPLSTSLGALDDRDWAILSNRWARGSDWNVRKVGRRFWEIATIPDNAGFPLFKRKRDACEALDRLILMESHHRAWKREPALRGGE